MPSSRSGSIWRSLFQGHQHLFRKFMRLKLASLFSFGACEDGEWMYEAPAVVFGLHFVTGIDL